jgi:sugar/nucleoside kinase (ribokinase family)
MITDDGQRTMLTYLGACTELKVSDVTEETVGAPKIVLIEGYVWDIAEGPALARRAMEIAAKNGTKVALSLSDSFCVERHRASFAQAVEDGVDIVVADQSEVEMLLGTSGIDDTVKAALDSGIVFAITRGPDGSVICIDGDTVVQAADKVDRVVDTTGAGDAYTAGFLYGWSKGWPVEAAARLGTHAATQVIQRVGARIPAGVMEGFRR